MDDSLSYRLHELLFSVDYANNLNHLIALPPAIVLGQKLAIINQLTVGSTPLIFSFICPWKSYYHGQGVDSIKEGQRFLRHLAYTIGFFTSQGPDDEHVEEIIREKVDFISAIIDMAIVSISNDLIRGCIYYSLEGTNYELGRSTSGFYSQGYSSSV